MKTPPSITVPIKHIDRLLCGVIAVLKAEADGVAIIEALVIVVAL